MIGTKITYDNKNGYQMSHIKYDPVMIVDEGFKKGFIECIKCGEPIFDFCDENETEYKGVHSFMCSKCFCEIFDIKRF